MPAAGGAAAAAAAGAGGMGICCCIAAGCLNRVGGAYLASLACCWMSLDSRVGERVPDREITRETMKEITSLPSTEKRNKNTPGVNVHIFALPNASI
jgi:hypothetical protein